VAYKYSVGKRDFGDIEYEGDVDTQIDFESDFIALTTGGTKVLIVSGSKVGIGTSTPSQNLHVHGSGDTTLRVQGSDGYYGALNVKGGTGDSAWVWQPADTSDLRFFTVDDDRMVILGSGEVGIGTTSPDYTLDVAGDAGFNEYLYHNGDADTYIRFQTNNVNLVAGGKSAIKLDTSTGKIQINNGNDDLDVQITADDGEVIIHTDAGTNKVGIGTDAPDYTLDVAGNVGIDEYIKHNGDSDTYIRFEADEINIVAGDATLITAMEGGGGDQADKVTINNDPSDVDFQVKGANEANLIRTDAANDKVGIGTAEPKVILDVIHDPTSLSDNTGGGEVVTFGSGTLTAGKLYYLNSSGAWAEIDADSVTTSDGLLGIALGTGASDGVLLRGFFDATTYLSNFIKGSAVYLSTTAASMDTTAPSATGDIVRCVGWCTDTANVIYFNPSATYLELS